MPIREESFRMGCGRYIQGKGYILKVADEVLKLGNSPLIIGDDTALGICRDKIEKSLNGKCKKYEFYYHNDTCCDDYATEISDFVKKSGYDVILGVGGGVIMDFAKLCAYFSKLPVVNIPTSSATCASYAPLSVRYRKDGTTVGSKHYETEVNAVIVDTEIMINQPVRLFLSGVFDSLAKFIEIKHRFKGDITNPYPMGLDYAYVMSEHSYKLLKSKTEKCIEDMKTGNISEDFENVIFTVIAATGVISGIARGSNQCALAHKFYETTRFFYPQKSKPYLHGELVGVGLLLQNHYNGECSENSYLYNLMKNNNMPYSICDVGVEASEENFEKYYDKICHSSAIDLENKEECSAFYNSLKYFWNYKGEK